ncbi:MAG: hypothetical protein LBC97_00800 [Bifidobacteriaceae bacterium]|jgi:hypothetical protein|nr:hypothetical protein [Bifidobacteriaceae bacterium]
MLTIPEVRPKRITSIIAAFSVAAVGVVAVPSAAVSAVPAAAPTQAISKGPVQVGLCPPLYEADNKDGLRCLVDWDQVRARGFNRCLENYRVNNPINRTYLPSQCYGNKAEDLEDLDPEDSGPEPEDVKLGRLYAEAIAQARLVQFYNQLLATVSPGMGVAPGGDPLVAASVQRQGVVASPIQWELQTKVWAKKRADVALIDSDWGSPATNRVQLIELKLLEPNDSRKRAQEQVQGYADNLRSEFGWLNAAPADMTGYLDRFYVVNQCDGPGGSTAYATDEWEAKGEAKGVVAVRKIDEHDCVEALRENQIEFTSAAQFAMANVAVPLDDNVRVPPHAPAPSVPAPPEHPSDAPSLSEVGIGAAETAEAIVRLVVTLRRFDAVLNMVCLAVINPLTRGFNPYDGSLTTPAAACLEAKNAAAFILAASLAGVVFTPEQKKQIRDALVYGDDEMVISASGPYGEGIGPGGGSGGGGSGGSGTSGGGGGGGGPEDTGDEGDGPPDAGSKNAKKADNGYTGSQTQPQASDPVIVDVAGDGFSPTTAEAGAYFDLDVNGYAERINWVQDDDRVLAWDRNGNGRIDNGLEVFGDSTKLTTGAAAGSGYVALGELDSNGNNAVDPEDSSWEDLVLWADTANLGRTDPGELQSLDDLDVKSISLEARPLDQTVEVGVVLGQGSQVTFGDGLVHLAAEYWVSTVSWDTIEPDLDDEAGVPEDVRRLPNVRSWGWVPSLHRAVMGDASGRVRELIEGFATAADTAAREALVKELVLSITGADKVALGSRGPNFDARKLAAIEAILGRNFNGVSGPNPNTGAALILEGVWTRLYEIYYCELLYQTRLVAIHDLLNSDLVEDDRLDVSGLVGLAGLLEAAGAAGDAFLADLGRYMFYLQQGGIAGLDELSAALGPAGLGLYRDMPQIGSMLWFGTERNDTITTTAGWPTAYGMGGNDTLNGSASADELYGGAGNDRLYGNAGDDFLDGGSDNDTLDGGAGDDRLVAGTGNDTVYSGVGEDFLVGGAGDDWLDGGAGKDVYDLAGGGVDVVADSGNATVVVFPEGVVPEDLTVSKSGSGLVFHYPGGSLEYREWYSYSPGSAGYDLYYKPAAFQFADGTHLTAAHVKAIAPH